MNLVIVAAGLGSRLSPLTDGIPKFLVNIGKNTGYVEMIRYWSEQLQLEETPKKVIEYLGDVGVPNAPIDTLTVIVHSSYVALVAEYHKMYFPKIPLIIKTVDVANGSAHAILSSCEHLIKQSVLFSWCDVIPVDPIPTNELVEMYGGANIVFTSYNNSNRYGLVKLGKGAYGVVPRLDPNERGGCFGLYYVNNFDVSPTVTDGQDFIEILEQFGRIREHRLENVIDFGDMPKLRRTQSKADEAREFNSIEFVGEYVLKQAMNDQGRKILKKEVAWYQHLDSLIEPHQTRPAVPRTWIASDGSGFFMSKVQGVPIWKAWHGLSPVDRAHVLSQLIEQRQHLFGLQRSVPGVNTVLADVRQEAHTKLLDRYQEIKGVIEAFGTIKTVNSHTLREPDPVITINRLFAALESYYMNHPDTEYGFIHGDLQFSNSMVDVDTMNVTIIDPRGYFGHSSLLGLEDYDIGKLLYALNGYDSFNSSRDFFISRERTAIAFDIPAPTHQGVESIMAEHFKPVHYGWLAVCFVGLAGYIKNDPVKSIAAHYHGLVLAEKWLMALN